MLTFVRPGELRKARWPEFNFQKRQWIKSAGTMKLGFKGRMTAHGFRALARTAIREEELDYEPDVIEMQLAHKPRDPLGAAYDRAQFLKQRTKMMQDWADFISKANH